MTTETTPPSVPMQPSTGDVGHVFAYDGAETGELLGIVPVCFGDRGETRPEWKDRVEHFHLFFLSRGRKGGQVRPKMAMYQTTSISTVSGPVMLEMGETYHLTEEAAKEDAARMMQTEILRLAEGRARHQRPEQPAPTTWTCWDCGCEYPYSRTPESYDPAGSYCGC